MVVCGATQFVCGAKWLFAASIEDGRRAVAAAERRVQDVAVRRVEHRSISRQASSGRFRPTRSQT